MITAGDLPTAVFDVTANAKSMMSAFDYPWRPAGFGRIISRRRDGSTIRISIGAN